jgi:uncharacterized BrkB/YihY/UPF0761 family membrane protein
MEPSKAGGARRRIKAVRTKTGELQERAQAALEEGRQRRGWVRLLLEAYERDRDRGGGLLAGGLAYRIFLWELPAVLFVVALFGTIASAAGSTPDEAARQSGLSGAIATTISQAVTQAGRNRWWLMVLGFVLMMGAGRSAARALRLIAGLAWRVREPGKVSSMKASLVFNGVIFAGIAVNLLLGRIIRGFFLLDIAEWILSTLLLAALAVGAMILLPHGGRPWYELIPGAVLFGVAARGLAIFTQVYLAPKIDRIDDLYGSLALAIGIQLGLYLIARVWVACQSLNATIAAVPPNQWFSSSPPPDTAGDAAR